MASRFIIHITNLILFHALHGVCCGRSTFLSLFKNIARHYRSWCCVVVFLMDAVVHMVYNILKDKTQYSHCSDCTITVVTVRFVFDQCITIANIANGTCVCVCCGTVKRAVWNHHVHAIFSFCSLLYWKYRDEIIYPQKIYFNSTSQNGQMHPYERKKSILLHVGNENKRRDRTENVHGQLRTHNYRSLWSPFSINTCTKIDYTVVFVISSLSQKL